MANHSSEPREIAPPPSTRWHWTGKAIAQWLIERLAEPPATLVGTDHGFSFPLDSGDRVNLSFLAEGN